MVDVRRIIEETAREYDLDPEDLMACYRPQRLVRARYVAMTLARDMLGLTQAEIGLAFNRHRTSVSHGLMMFAYVQVNGPCSSNLVQIGDIMAYRRIRPRLKPGAAA